MENIWTEEKTGRNTRREQEKIREEKKTETQLRHGRRESEGYDGTQRVTLKGKQT